MELLAVIVILGIIALIAVPNMIGISDDVKKEQMLDDAKRLISVAKMKINASYSDRELGNRTYTLVELNEGGVVAKDPDGGSYESSSYVRYTSSSGTATYCIYLSSSKRRIGTSSSCINENNLYSKTNVVNR